MSLRTDLKELQTKDIYSLMLFALYKTKDVSEYSVLSELSYLLDEESLLRLCRFYGGMTITIPTTDELETMLNALLLIQKVDIENCDYNETINSMTTKIINRRDIETAYVKLREVLSNYDFNSQR